MIKLIDVMQKWPLDLDNFITLYEVLHILRPEALPGFSIGWLNLIAYKPYVLWMLSNMESKNLVNAGNYWQLLIDGLSFLKINLFESRYPVSEGIK